jgi:hypothetical protein
LKLSYLRCGERKYVPSLWGLGEGRERGEGEGRGRGGKGEGKEDIHLFYYREQDAAHYRAPRGGIL